MIRRGLFHSTKAVSDGGIFMLEIETPNDKNDLVRLSDEYGRADSGYETSDHEMTKTNECVWLEDPELNELHEYNVNGAKLTVERSNDIELLNKKNDNDIIVFLRGGLGKHIDGRKHLATMPGDVGRVGIVKKVAREMDFLEEHTTILTIPVE